MGIDRSHTISIQVPRCKPGSALLTINWYQPEFYMAGPWAVFIIETFVHLKKKINGNIKKCGNVSLSNIQAIKK